MGVIYVFGVRGWWWVDGATAQLEVVFFDGFDGVGNFLCFWGFGMRGLCWVYGATACFCKGFQCFVKNGFFREIDFFVCFDIYVWGWKFYFVFVYIKYFKKWFIILGFLVGSVCLIW